MTLLVGSIVLGLTCDVVDFSGRLPTFRIGSDTLGELKEEGGG